MTTARLPLRPPEEVAGPLPIPGTYRTTQGSHSYATLSRTRADKPPCPIRDQAGWPPSGGWVAPYSPVQRDSTLPHRASVSPQHVNVVGGKLREQAVIGKLAEQQRGTVLTHGGC